MKNYYKISENIYLMLFERLNLLPNSSGELIRINSDTDYDYISINLNKNLKMSMNG